MNQPSMGFPHGTKHTGMLSELTEMPIEAVQSPEMCRVQSSQWD